MLLRLEKRDQVAILWINNPPVNALSQAVAVAVVNALKDAEADSSIAAVVLACEGRTFIAGADISEMRESDDAANDYPDVLGALEQFPKVIVAALHGTGLGAGFEMALTCDYRVALASAKVGLPEVNIGILPGGGGTQRLPRLAGVEVALNLMLTGVPMKAPAALAAGAVDRVVESSHVEAAVDLAREKSQLPRRRVSDLKIDPSSLPEGFFEKARKRLHRERRGQHAPQRIIDCVEAAATLPFREGLAVEWRQFEACMRDPQAAALRHVFFAERQLKNIPGLPANTETRPINAVGVIGAGTMGGGITMNFLNVGIPVTLVDSNQAALDRGLARIRQNYDISVSRGRLTPNQVDGRMALVRPTLSYEDLGAADLIIEAVFETLDLKEEVFRKADAVAKPGAILGSNTSRLSIDALASATSRPGDVVGTHFFSPANVMRLFEIVRGVRTRPDTLKTMIEMANRIGKIAIISADVDGFIGNRMVIGYLRQADHLLLEGAAPEQIDGALRDFGMAMGPFEMVDITGGLDVGYKSRRNYAPGSFDERASIVADRLYEQGRFGQKSGGGYYDYPDGGRIASPSASLRATVEKVAAELGIERRAISDEEIVERCLLEMFNIGCDVLHEQVAYRSGDIDLVYVHGYGFPAHRGGPMYYVEHEIGLPAALEKIRRIGELTGTQWLTPSPLLERLVAEGSSLNSTG